MTDRKAMLELAERCEAASGPDRELDCRIWSAGGAVSFEIVQQVVPDLSQWQAPYYTASVDAALSLVDGVGVLITLSEIKGDGMPLCVIGNPANSDLFEAVANTMPLALCAAALKARAQ